MAIGGPAARKDPLAQSRLCNALSSLSSAPAPTPKPLDCDAATECSGHGTCKVVADDTGSKCVCAKPYSGADCSVDGCAAFSSNCAACQAERDEDQFPHGCMWDLGKNACIHKASRDSVVDECPTQGYSLKVLAGAAAAVLAFLIWLYFWIKRKVLQLRDYLFGARPANEGAESKAAGDYGR